MTNHAKKIFRMSLEMGKITTSHAHLNLRHNTYFICYKDRATQLNEFILILVFEKESRYGKLLNASSVYNIFVLQGKPQR
ncbi:hypothetical protein BpHYR1_044956 [Brachionus plicatilis]|uniref:Uncharacterized protein n=1 Tax=Brachionus plicatilis TaxID=10195 RepID=A0A3M7S0E4_BRAPC|nr:hypothetical protein BpHYR1_044956 [Brachionus plicatilis]